MMARNYPQFVKSCSTYMSAMSPVVGLFETVARVPQMATLCTWSCTPNRPANLLLCRKYATKSDKNDQNNKNFSSTRQKSTNKSKSPDPVFDEFHNIHFESRTKSTPPSSSTTFKRHPSTSKFNNTSNKNNSTKSNDSKSSNNNKPSSSNTSNRHTSGSTQSASSSSSSGSKKKFNPRHRKTPWDMTLEEFIFKNSYAYADCREDEEMVKAYFSQKRRQANRQKTIKKTIEEDDSDDEDPFTTSYSNGGASDGNANARNFPGSKPAFHPDFSDWFENYNSSYEGGRDHSSSSSSSYKRSKGSWEEEAFRSKYQEQMSLDELLRSFRSKSMNWDSSFKAHDDQESFNNFYHNFDPQKLYEKFYSKANRGNGAAGGSANGHSSQNFKYNHHNSSYGSSFPSATPADVVSNLSVLGLTPQGGTHISADKTGGPAPSWSQMDEAFLKRAFRVRALEWHPDRHTCPSGKAKAEERFKEMQVAYEALRVKLQARG